MPRCATHLGVGSGHGMTMVTGCGKFITTQSRDCGRVTKLPPDLPWGQ
jgi:hypothetical protein